MWHLPPTSIFRMAFGLWPFPPPFGRLSAFGDGLRPLAGEEAGSDAPHSARAIAPSVAVADEDHVGIRQDVHHQVAEDPEPDALEQALQLPGRPVVDDAAGAHQEVERVSEPALVGRLRVHVLDDEATARPD